MRIASEDRAYLLSHYACDRRLALSGLTGHRSLRRAYETRFPIHARRSASEFKRPPHGFPACKLLVAQRETQMTLSVNQKRYLMAACIISLLLVTQLAATLAIPGHVAQAQSPTLVTVQGPTKFTLPPEKTAELRMFVEPEEGIDLNRLRVALIDLRDGETQLPVDSGVGTGDKPLFDVQEEVDDRDRFVRITVQVDDLQHSRDYTLTLLFTVKDGEESDAMTPALTVAPTAANPTAEAEATTTAQAEATATAEVKSRRQRVEVTVLHPASVLTVPASVEITRDSYWPQIGLFGLDTHGRTEDASIRIVSGPSTNIPGNSLQMEQAEGIAGSVLVHSKDLKDGKLTEEIGPNETRRVGLKIDDGFSLGTSTRTLELRAPQLDTPLNVSITVHHRIHLAWIALITLAGVFLGMVVRSSLPAVESSLRLTYTLQRIRRRVRKVKKSRPDSDFRNAVGKLEEDIAEYENTAIKMVLGISWLAYGYREEPEKIRAKAAEFEEQLKEALDDLKRRIDSATEKVKTLSNAVKSDWKLPTQLESPIMRLRNVIDEAKSALEEENPSEADNIIEGANNDILLLGTVIEQWAGDVYGILAPFPKEAVAVRSFAESADAATEELAAVIAAIPDPNELQRDKLVGLLRMVHRATTRLDDVASALDEPANLWPIIDKYLTDAARRNVTVLDQLKNHTARYEQLLDRLNIGKADSTDRIKAAGVSATKLLEDSIEAVRRQLDPAQQPPQALSDLLRVYDIEGAVKMIASGPPLVQPPIPAPAAAIPTPISEVEEVPWVPLKVLLRLPKEMLEIDQLNKALARTDFAIQAVGCLRTTILAVLVTLISYTLFGDSWFGTPGDWFKVFAWAFAIDLSTAKVLEMMSPSE